MHTIATSSGPRVVALHSSGAGARQWNAYRAWVDPAWQWTAPDLLGYGSDAAWQQGERTSLAEEAARLVPLLGRSDAPPVHLVGHSYGGTVALQLALTQPQRVASLTLYEPVRFALLRDDDDAAPWRDIVAVGRCIGALASAGRLRDSAQCFVDYWSGPGTWRRLAPGRQDAVAERMPKVHAEFEALFDDDVRAQAYGALEMPLLLVSGSASPLPASRVAQRLAALCPHARLLRWAGADHMAPVTQAARFAALLPCATASVQVAA